MTRGAMRSLAPLFCWVDEIAIDPTQVGCGD